jgi:magnesium-transporting ATPase (P-type)
MNSRKLSIITGVSYLIIFFAAIFANFVMLESLKQNPLETIRLNHMAVRFGILAFLITALFDVVVAWGLFNLYRKHQFTRLSTYFRLMHAAIMGVAVFALVLTLNLDSANEILYQVNVFEIIWLIGLFFFGAHLILLSTIIKKPKWIAVFLTVAGIMYMFDTAAHFLLPNYAELAGIFLALVAVPSILGEMAFTVWLLVKGGKENWN